MIRNYIQEYQYYDGVKAPKTLSASQISRDVLELYYSLTETAKEGVFGKGNIGSIFHMGMEEMFKKHVSTKSGRFVQEKRFDRDFGGWTINGKMDMVDFIDHVIYDWKGMSASVYAEFKKNDKYHRVNVQMAAYNWLLGGTFTAEAHCFITNWDPCNPAHPAMAYQIVECDIMSCEEFEEYMGAKIELLEKHLTAMKVPAKCEDVMPRYITSSKTYINSKCEYYCSYAHVCSRKRDDSAKTLGLKWSRD